MLQELLEGGNIREVLTNNLNCSLCLNESKWLALVEMGITSKTPKMSLRLLLSKVFNVAVKSRGKGNCVDEEDFFKYATDYGKKITGSIISFPAVTNFITDMIELKRLKEIGGNLCRI